MTAHNAFHFRGHTCPRVRCIRIVSPAPSSTQHPGQCDKPSLHYKADQDCFLLLPRHRAHLGGVTVGDQAHRALVDTSPLPALSCLPTALLGILYEDKERQDFIFTIYHWWQAVAIFAVYLGWSLPMKVRLTGVGRGLLGH